MLPLLVGSTARAIASQVLAVLASRPLLLPGLNRLVHAMFLLLTLNIPSGVIVARTADFAGYYSNQRVMIYIIRDHIS